MTSVVTLITKQEKKKMRKVWQGSESPSPPTTFNKKKKKKKKTANAPKNGAMQNCFYNTQHNPDEAQYESPLR